MNKLEMYNSIVKMTVETGQGLAGTIVRNASHEYSLLLDELLEDGLIDRYIKSYSLLPSDEWIVPKGCYIAIKDNDNEHPHALSFIRFYLGVKDDLSIHIKQSVPFMENYIKWLKDNEQGLIDLVNLKELDYLTIELSEKDIKWVQSKQWYINNESVSTCYDESVKKLVKDNKINDVNKQMLDLCKNISKYKEKTIELKEEIRKHEKFGRIRKHVNDWLWIQDQSLSIQDII